MIPLHVLTSDNYEQQWEFETLLHGFREVLQRFARQQEKANDISDEAIHLLKSKASTIIMFFRTNDKKLHVPVKLQKTRKLQVVP
ncbi:unnamed protein product [Rotaria socialis]|uniref:Uncharacterized protein n=1 Tax=Rotaria socialis TaxID=392032 RepID=A0A821TBL7_9BILA|nr:unnamed protein product [Rotaria socialis]CAF3775361.1 unnamed protein product [Rotaria socialis]CAF4386688.1 unnamed protein product [Rotaria socialis]CAF4783144.1 unnamed protein product [Rotaria socialis]CAF4873334.1 unnamed protein product [Rotaria socialis]